MSWFNNLKTTAEKGISTKIPPSIINVGGDIIRNTIGLGGKRGPVGPVRNIESDDATQHVTSFNNFLTDIRVRGVSRSNRYIVALYGIPQKMSDNMIKSGFSPTLNYISRDNMAFISRSCETASFPGQTIQTQETRMQGYLSKFPTLRNYNETTWTFRCDNEMLEKKFFDFWVNTIINKDTGDITFKNDFVMHARIFQFDEHGKATYQIFLENVFPINIGNLDLQAQQGEYHRLSITFAYDKIHVTGVDNPEYRDIEISRATGATSLSLYDRITNEIFKQGKNVILREINKNVPIGNIPGIGNSRDILGALGL